MDSDRPKAAHHSSGYKVRQDILENGRVRCPAFSIPLMSFDSESDSDADVPQSDNPNDIDNHPTVIKAKKTWKKLFKLIMDKRSDVPLKQMALKAKHESVLFDKM